MRKVFFFNNKYYIYTIIYTTITYPSSSIKWWIAIINHIHKAHNRATILSYHAHTHTHTCSSLIHSHSQLSSKQAFIHSQRMMMMRNVREMVCCGSSGGYNLISRSAALSISLSCSCSSLYVSTNGWLVWFDVLLHDACRNSNQSLSPSKRHHHPLRLYVCTQ